MTEAGGRGSSPRGVLRRIPDAPPAPRRPVGEHCELCSEPIGDEHPHVVDIEVRMLRCTCRGCYLLFTPDGAGGSRMRAVPDRYHSFPGLELSPAQWDSLQIPVSVAFFFVNSSLDRVCGFYPSPIGATESLLSLDAWDVLVGSNPALGTLLPDVEAVLVRSERGGPAECFLVPIDICYELVGALRTSWKGFDGGREAHEVLEAFFTKVRDRAGPLGVPTL